jgi:hypothetical protein
MVKLTIPMTSPATRTVPAQVTLSLLLEDPIPMDMDMATLVAIMATPVAITVIPTATA